MPQKKAAAAPEFQYQELFSHGTPVDTPYRRLDDASKFVTTVDIGDGTSFVKVGPEALQPVWPPL